jgi:cobalt/nickel transport protein
MPPIHNRKLWFRLFLLMLVTPLGIWIPEIVHSKGAWGEWTSADLERMLGRAPAGLSALREVWSGILPNYGMVGLDKPWQSRIAYLASALLGTALIILIAGGLGKYWTSTEKRPAEGGLNPK